MSGFCPDWYAWMLAADRLHMAAPDLEDHPHGEWWRHRAFVALDAENRAEKHRSKPKPGRAAR